MLGSSIPGAFGVFHPEPSFSCVLMAPCRSKVSQIGPNICCPSCESFWEKGSMKKYKRRLYLYENSKWNLGSFYIQISCSRGTLTSVTSPLNTLTSSPKRSSLETQPQDIFISSHKLSQNKPTVKKGAQWWDFFKFQSEKDSYFFT